MPYIKQEDRDRLQTESFGHDLFLPKPKNCGELNYIFTLLSLEYFSRPEGGNYQAINDIIGALEGCKAEFQRRVVAPYENKKIDQNGDVP